MEKQKIPDNVLPLDLEKILENSTEATELNNAVEKIRRELNDEPDITPIIGDTHLDTW